MEPASGGKARGEGDVCPGRWPSIVLRKAQDGLRQCRGEVGAGRWLQGGKSTSI
jgi:hypothetical protein